MNTMEVFLPTTNVRWTDLVKDAKREATARSGHSNWELSYVDEYNREVANYNDQGRKTGTVLEAKVVLKTRN